MFADFGEDRSAAPAPADPAGLTSRLAEWGSGVVWQDLPDDVRSVASGMLNDCLAVALAGSVEDGVQRLRAIEQPSDGGTRRLADASGMAVIFGTSAHALDYDDIHLPMGGHPSAVTLGAVLGAAALADAAPADVWAGFVAAIETAARIGRAISDGHYHVGWHPTSVIGALAATAGASRVLGLGLTQTRSALGLAAAMASGTKANFGTFSKPVQVGHASRCGLIAAVYTAEGLNANTRILDDQHGAFTRLFSERVEEEALTDRLGSYYSFTDPQPVIKLIPACGGVHAATWAAISLAEDHDWDPEEIVSITAEVHPKRIPHTDRARITSGLEGKFSTQYCISVAATQRRVGLADFEGDTIFEPRRQALMRRAHLTAAPDADEWPGAADYSTGSRGARVTAELSDGSVFQRFLGAAPGYPGNVATPAQLEGKFLDCSQRAVPEEMALGWWKTLDSRTEALPDQTVQQIFRTIVFG